MEKQIDCSFTGEIVCPHCGYEFSDSWEFFIYNNNKVEPICEECNKEFIAFNHTTIDYSSHKKK